MRADTWAAGNGPLQIPVAGLLGANPELRDAELPESEWQDLLAEYLRSERP